MRKLPHEAFGRVLYRPARGLSIEDDDSQWLEVHPRGVFANGTDFVSLTGLRPVETYGGPMLTWYDVSNLTAIDIVNQPGLHREFAAIERNTTAVLRFAQMFGMLGRNLYGRLEHPSVGEYVLEWYRAVETLRAYIELYDLGESPKAVADWFGSSATEALKRGSGANGIERSSDMDSHRLTLAVLVQNCEMDILKGGSPMRSRERLLRFALGPELSTGVTVGVEPEPGGTVKLFAQDLLGAVYIHFMNEVVGIATQPIKCLGCGKWFVPHEGRQKYHDNACKQRAHRARRKELEASDGN